MKVYCTKMLAKTSLIIFCFASVLAKEETQLDLNFGRIIGVKEEVDGYRAEVYNSIPYALPPSGDRRFEMPQSIDRLKESFNSSVTVSCPSIDGRPMREDPEDCLYMTVVIPLDQNGKRYNEPLPTVFWIHGGSYNSGSKQQYKIKRIIQKFSSKKVIFVAPNYRLSVLGFLTQLTPELPGNFGLADMIQALRVVRENAKKMGVDQDKITVAGESAGAGAAALLAVSPLTKGNFSAAIFVSGSSQADWSVRSRSSKIFSSQVIAACNCTHKNSSHTKECLKKLRYGVIHLAAIHSFRADLYESMRMATTFVCPVVDDFMGDRSIVPARPKDNVRENARIPVLITSVNNERDDGMLSLAYNRLLISNSIESRSQVVDAVIARYLNDSIGKTIDDVLPNLEKLLTVDLASPSYEEALLYAANNQTVHTIMNSVFPEYKTNHGNDLYTIFGSSSFFSVCKFCEYHNQTTGFENRLSDALTSFIANRSIPNFPIFTLNNRVGTLLTNEGTETSDMHVDEFYFWRRTIPTIISLNISQESSTENKF